MEWIVIIGHRSSKSTFSAQNENLRPLLNTNIPLTRPSKQCKSLIRIMILGFLCFNLLQNFSRGTIVVRDIVARDLVARDIDI